MPVWPMHSRLLPLAVLALAASSPGASALRDKSGTEVEVQVDPIVQSVYLGPSKSGSRGPLQRRQPEAARAASPQPEKRRIDSLAFKTLVASLPVDAAIAWHLLSRAAPTYFVAPGAVPCRPPLLKLLALAALLTVAGSARAKAKRRAAARCGHVPAEAAASFPSLKLAAVKNPNSAPNSALNSGRTATSGTRTPPSECGLGRQVSLSDSRASTPEIPACTPKLPAEVLEAGSAEGAASGSAAFGAAFGAKPPPGSPSKESSASHKGSASSLSEVGKDQARAKERAVRLGGRHLTKYLRAIGAGPETEVYEIGAGEFEQYNVYSDGSDPELSGDEEAPLYAGTPTIAVRARVAKARTRTCVPRVPAVPDAAKAASGEPLPTTPRKEEALPTTPRKDR